MSAGNKFLVVCNKTIGERKIDDTFTFEQFILRLRAIKARSKHLRIVIIVHGYKASVNDNCVPEISDAILRHHKDESATVLKVDWRKESGYGSRWPNYRGAVNSLQAVGEWLAGHVRALRSEFKNEVYIHGVGFSLGAHVLGICARKSGHGGGMTSFDRISGLDPAGPRLRRSDTHRLCREDARIVDVIHTAGECRGKLLWTEGTLEPLGTIDFYVNGGKYQPNCAGLFSNGSHVRALDLFLASLRFPGEFCSSGVEMGYHFQGNADGTVHINTTGIEPYYL